MDTIIKRHAQKQSDAGGEVARKQIRGSSLLTVGRGISIAINFATQILIVRYLSKSDYGAWAYALALVAFFQAFASFGLDRSITRFIPIYHENEEYDKLSGTILLTVLTVVVSGSVIIVLLYTAPEFISGLISDKKSGLVDLIPVLIFLVPVHAIDETLIGLFASFAHPRAIFFRKHVLGPLLKLTVAILLVVFGSSVLFLAYGYLFASVLGVLIYTGVLMRLLRNRGILQQLHRNSIHIPAREIFTFTLPLLSSDLLLVAIHSTDTLMLGYFHGTTEIASYQVILPLVHTNTIVFHSFGLLYTAFAARLFAKNDYAGINALYWRTATWLTVLSFPLFVVTFCMAEPVTSILYGTRYENSYRYLQLLALAYYFNTALGLNGLTLQVMGKIRYVVIINITALMINVVLNLLLIPVYGALGAAVSTAASMVIHNVLKQAGLRLASGVNIFDWNYLSFYLIIITASVSLFVVQISVNSMYVLLPLAIVTFLLIVKLCQHHLRIEQTFPELLKLPLARFLFRTP